MAGGRPTDYAVELAAAICEMISHGKSLNKIVKMDGMPKASTVYRWIGTHPEFRDMYEEARSDQADTLAEEILDIAEDCDAENVQVARLQVDARKWVAARLKPRKWGDKVTNEHTGADGGPIGVAITVGYKDGSS